MNTKKDYFKIEDWAGNLLFSGHINDSKNYAHIFKINDLDDIYCYWLDENDERNVYEYIYF